MTDSTIKVGRFYGTEIIVENNYINETPKTTDHNTDYTRDKKHVKM
jgi:hypothetical protein